jgi:cellulose 1,4-beta-cellobiosidase
MPKQVSAIFHASSSWNTVQPTLGVYSVSYDIWLNKTSTTSGQPNGAELMIWLNRQGGIQPAGSLITSAVSIAGANWDVWLGTNNGINVISYVRSTGVTSVCNLNLKDFLTDAKTRGYIQPAWYLISVEAGFQVWQDGVGLASSAFNILVE